jgi:hypothetical protein
VADLFGVAASTVVKWMHRCARRAAARRVRGGDKRSGHIETHAGQVRPEEHNNALENGQNPAVGAGQNWNRTLTVA